MFRCINVSNDEQLHFLTDKTGGLVELYSSVPQLFILDFILLRNVLSHITISCFGFNLHFDLLMSKQNRSYYIL